MRRSRGRVVVTLALLLGMTVVVAASTRAASWQQLRLVRSSPEEGARLTTPPERIRLWFSAPPELAVSLIRVTGPAGVVELGELRTGDDDSLVAPVVGDLLPGEYRVTWRTSLGGGRPVRGTIDFSLLGGDSSATMIYHSRIDLSF